MDREQSLQKKSVSADAAATWFTASPTLQQQLKQSVTICWQLVQHAQQESEPQLFDQSP